MPNRIIKESICTSEDIAGLSMGAEILFYHLMVKADDFGVYFGNEQIIKNTCFPLKSSEIKVKQVESWLNELIKAGLIFAYVAEDGKKYIQFVKWAKHQQIRAKKSKYPTFDSTCNQLLADDDNSCRNPIQSNPNPIRIRIRIRTCASECASECAGCICSILERLSEPQGQEAGRVRICKGDTESRS